MAREFGDNDPAGTSSRKCSKNQQAYHLNALAEGHDYLRLGMYKPSPDHSLLAYSLDTTGAEQYSTS